MNYFRTRQYIGLLAAMVIVFLIFLPNASAATVSTPVIKPDDPKVYIPEYCWYVNDPAVCDGNHFRIDEQPTTQPIKKIENIKPRNVPGKKLPKYYHGHRRQR